MSKWKKTFDVSDMWRKAKNDEITIQVLSKTVAERLEKLKKSDDYGLEIEDFVDEFKDFSQDESLDKNDFDNIWNRFYNFADRNRIWVKIFS
jgi:hypothetical protein